MSGRLDLARACVCVGAGPFPSDHRPCHLDGSAFSCYWTSSYRCCHNRQSGAGRGGRSWLAG